MMLTPSTTAFMRASKDKALKVTIPEGAPKLYEGNAADGAGEKPLPPKEFQCSEKDMLLTERG